MWRARGSIEGPLSLSTQGFWRIFSVGRTQRRSCQCLFYIHFHAHRVYWASSKCQQSHSVERNVWFLSPTVIIYSQPPNYQSMFTLAAPRQAPVAPPRVAQPTADSHNTARTICNSCADTASEYATNTSWPRSRRQKGDNHDYNGRSIGFRCSCAASSI